MCLHPSSRASPLRVRTRYLHTLRAWKTGCIDFRRLWTIPKSHHVMLPRLWRSPACHPQSCEEEHKSMLRPRQVIGLPSRRLTTTGDQNESRWFRFLFDRNPRCSLPYSVFIRDTDIPNECRKSGLKSIEIGCLTQVCYHISTAAFKLANMKLAVLSHFFASSIRRSTDTQARRNARRTFRDTIAEAVSRTHCHTQ